MADYITKIRTADGDLPFDYNSLANAPILKHESVVLTEEVNTVEFTLGDKPEIIYITISTGSANLKCGMNMDIPRKDNYVNYAMGQGYTFQYQNNIVLHIHPNDDIFSSHVTALAKNAFYAWNGAYWKSGVTQTVFRVKAFNDAEMLPVGTKISIWWK